MRRSIQRLLEDALAEEVLKGRFKEGDTIMTVLEGEIFRFDKAAGSPKKEKAAKAEKAPKGEDGGDGKDGDNVEAKADKQTTT